MLFNRHSLSEIRYHYNMKKSIFILLFISFCFSNKSFAQTGEKKGWPSAERFSFISSCIETAKANMSVDSARFYCYCMQEKVEEKYPTVDEASKITEAEMESSAFQEYIKNCLNGFWSTAERSEFLTNCISSAKAGGISGEKANSYCECMLFKVEIKFPNPLDTNKLTSELLSTPEWKKILQGCLEF